ncbi:MAG: phospho-N-acetylmuramoyl-pentapeptide-transferase, partial [Oscillospiraceae bacterium]|nr:phospho-N-acetylmuramoyl-pentapeptide-transferase [Oscillospiraceae bacterium]
MNTWMIVAALAAFGVTALSGLVLVPWLRKLKYGQTILDIGPKWHEKKQGTPTMGGIMFMLGITVA